MMKKLSFLLLFLLSTYTYSMEQQNPLNGQKALSENSEQKELVQKFKALTVDDAQTIANVFHDEHSYLSLLPKDVRTQLQKTTRSAYKYTHPYLPLIKTIDLKYFNTYSQFGSFGKTYRFSHDHRYLAIKSMKGEIVIVDIFKNEIVSNILLQDNDIASCFFLPNKPLLIIFFHNGTISLWNYENHTMEGDIGNIPAPSFLALDDDGNYIALSDTTGIFVWNTHTHELLEIHDHQQPITALSFIPHSHTLISTDVDGLIIKDLDTETMNTIIYHSNKSRLAVSSNGTYCATYHADQITFYDLKKAQVLSNIFLSDVYISKSAFTPDNSHFIIYDANHNTLCLIDIVSGQVVHTISIPNKHDYHVKHNGSIKCDNEYLVCFNIDNEKQLLLMLTSLNLIYVYDIKTFEKLTVLKPNIPDAARIYTMEFINNDSQLALVTDSEIQVIDLVPSLEQAFILEKLRKLSKIDDDIELQETIEAITASPEYKQLDYQLKASIDAMIENNQDLKIALQNPNLTRNHDVLANFAHWINDNVMDKISKIVEQYPKASKIIPVLGLTYASFRFGQYTKNIDMSTFLINAGLFYSIANSFLAV